MAFSDGLWRHRGLALFAVLVAAFAAISIGSFAGRDRPQPSDIHPLTADAVEGQRVFQAYNCMDCHTVLGNGAYFAPDITGVYASDGPAWTSALFSQLRVWPTKAMVDSEIARLTGEGKLKISNAEYYQTFTAAADDSATRGGWKILMPRLPLKPEEVDALVAFLAYLSAMDTAGWPPETAPSPEILAREQGRLWRSSGGPTPPPVPTTPSTAQ